ncbi:MAG: hypothetical protein ACPF9W_12570 [Nocardioides sp.]
MAITTATDVVDNASIPENWRVNDVRDLVTLLLIPSPNRRGMVAIRVPT